ncbi:MAG: sugar ABC transporter permease [Actinomycetes bacterium]|nr:MAG: sugar ABC transporter permease [Actinomycetota bacterium]
MTPTSTPTEVAAAPTPRASALTRVARLVDDRDRFVLPAPAVIVIVLLLLVPVGFTIYLSFHEWSGGNNSPEWVGLDNYQRSLTDGRFWGSVVRTAYFVVLSVGLQILLGIAAALIFHRQFRGRGIARAFFMFPMIATPAAIALVWKMMYDPTIGVLNYLTQAAGGPQLLWTSDARLVIPALAIVDTWQWTPLVMLIVLAGMSALPHEPYEAARLDGANELRIFTSITLPLLRPVIIVAAMFRLIDCIKTFDIIMIITAGGPGHSSETLNLYAYHQNISFLHFGYGSALLVWLTVLVFGVAWALDRMRRKAVAS